MGTTLTSRQAECVERLRAFDAFVSVDADAAARRGDWRRWAARRLGTPSGMRMILEVGCADGEFLTRVAAVYPNVMFVGLDWKYGDILSAAQRVAAADLKNVALLRGRAQDLLQMFGAGELDEIWLFHPEPIGAPLFDEAFLSDAAGLLAGAGSRVVLKTDHAGYYQRALALLGEAMPDWTVESPRARQRDLHAIEALPTANAAVLDAFRVGVRSLDLWRDPQAAAALASRPFGLEQTGYEQRFVARRRPIFYLELERRAR